MADVALRPTFPKDELERLRQQRLTSLLQARDDPATIAALAFSRVLYGTAHRYGTPRCRHRRDDQGVHRRRSARVLRVGVPARTTRRCSWSATSTPDKVMPLLETSFGSWKAPARRRPRDKLPAVDAAGDARDLSRRQAGRAAVADPHRLDRRAALDARLLSDSGDEHDPRRLVQLAPEHEPAREARLHLRRELRRSTCARRPGRSSRPPACRPTRRPRR